MDVASRIAARASLAFHPVVPPKKHKSSASARSVNETPVTRMRRKLFARAPGLEAMERRLGGAEDVVFCIKKRRGQSLAVNEAFLSRVCLGGREALLAAGYEQRDALVFSRGDEIC